MNAEYLNYEGLSLYDQKIKALIAAISDKLELDSAQLEAEIERALQAEAALNEKISSNLEDTEFELVKDSKVNFKLDNSQNDLRILVPDDAVFEQQQTGEGAANGVYYVGLRCWAPSKEARSCHKGSNETELATTDAIYFDEKTGRPYADMWLPVASQTDGVWTSYVASQPDGKYPGWNFEIHWLDIDGNEIAFKTKRISITNQKNFINHKDWYIGGMESSINTLKETIATMQGEGEGSIKENISTAIAQVVNGADSKFDTLKEIADWILSDETNTLDLLSRVSALESNTYRAITPEEINALFTDSTVPTV